MELIETCFLTSAVVYYKCVTLGGSTEHFTTALLMISKVSAYAKYSVQVTMHLGNLGIVTIRILG